MAMKVTENGREIVGLFTERDSFDRAVAALLSSGFERADLSVLASHESLEAAGRPGKSWREAMLAFHLPRRDLALRDADLDAPADQTGGFRRNLPRRRSGRGDDRRRHRRGGGWGRRG